MELKLIRALRFFIEYDPESQQSHVFNAPKLDAEGNEIEPGTTDKLPAALAQSRVDVGDAVFADPLDHDRDGKRGGSKKGEESTARKGRRAREKTTAADNVVTGDGTGEALPPAYEAAYEPVGKYVITGPDGFSETVKGKVARDQRLAELNGQARTAGADAPPAD